MFAAQIQESYPQSYMSQTPMNSACQVTQQLAQKTMQACDHQITVKLDKIRKCNETIESRMKEEAMRSKQTLYDILNKDEISLKVH